MNNGPNHLYSNMLKVHIKILLTLHSMSIYMGMITKVLICSRILTFTPAAIKLRVS